VEGADRTPTVEIGVLGSAMVVVDGQVRALPGPRSTRLLLRLVVGLGQPISGWELRADVWPGADTSDSTLRVAIGRLRALLGDDRGATILRHEPRGYLLDPDRVVLDADRFTALVAGARQAVSDPHRALRCYADALALWRGNPFDEVPFATAEAERLRSLREAAVEERLALAVADGAGAELLAELEAAVAEQPLRERRTASLMVALYRAGRQADALAAYRRLEATLLENLGLSPGEELRQLEVRLVSQDPTLLGPSATPRPASAGERAAAKCRAAQSLARRGLYAEAERLASVAVDDARATGDASVLVPCLVGAARVLAAAGHPAEAHQRTDEAISLARSAGDGNGLAAAAMVRFGFGMALDDRLLVDLLEPLDLLPPDAPTRVELLCAAMHQLALTGDPDSTEPLVREAATVASRVGDPRASTLVILGEAILAGIRQAAPEQLTELANAALASAEALGEPVLLIAAMHAVLRDRMSAGDIDGLASLLPRFDAAATESLLPFAQVRSTFVRSSIALARGDFADLPASIELTIAEGTRLGVASAGGAALAQLVMLQVERGDLEQVAAMLEAAPSLPLEQVTNALVAAESNRVDDAIALLETVFADGIPAVGGVSLFLGVLAAEAAWLAGWSGAPVLEPLLASGLGRCAVMSYATLTVGPVDRAAGLLALAGGRTQEAVDAMRAAMVVAGTATLWQARSQIGLAHALALRGDDGDLAEATALLSSLDGSPLLDADTGSRWLGRQHARALDALARSDAP
jgi:DNA-binding SARP family transcriptional activator